MLEYDQVTIKFDEQPLFDQLSFNVPKGAKMLVKGPSGSGKTSLLESFMGFVHPERGKIIVDNMELTAQTIGKIRNKTGYVPQEVPFRFEKVREGIEMVEQFKSNQKTATGSSQLHHLMDKLDLPEKILDRTFDEISGGQKQRIGILLPLYLGRKIILMDEPTSALDKETRGKVRKLLFEDFDLTILCTSHDEEWAKNFDSVITLG